MKSLMLILGAMLISGITAVTYANNTLNGLYVAQERNGNTHQAQYLQGDEASGLKVQPAAQINLQYKTNALDLQDTPDDVFTQGSFTQIQ